MALKVLLILFAVFCANEKINVCLFSQTGNTVRVTRVCRLSLLLYKKRDASNIFCEVFCFFLFIPSKSW